MTRLLYPALLGALAVAACSPRGADRATDATTGGDVVTAPAENDMDEMATDMSDDVDDATDVDTDVNVGADATNDATDLVGAADDIDVDADLPDDLDLDADTDYELEEHDIDAPAMDEEAVTEGDYVEDVMEMNEMDADGAQTVAEARDDYADVSAQGTLDAVTEAGGLTALGTSDALATIDRWIVKLESSGAATAVSGKLRELRGQLTASTLDGPAVGQTLVELGQLTQEAAGSSAADVNQLGSALESAGKDLLGQ